MPLQPVEKEMHRHPESLKLHAAFTIGLPAPIVSITTSDTTPYGPSPKSAMPWEGFTERSFVSFSATPLPVEQLVPGSHK